MEKGKIQFKPLHEGMGFHPFSDGLPYAPESKTKTTSTGAGATAAGRPQFAGTPGAPSAPAAAMPGPALAPATNNAPRVTARQLQERAQDRKAANPVTPALLSANLGQLPITHHEPLGRATTQTKAKKVEAKAPAKTEMPITAEALIRRRAFAYLLDTVIHAGFWLATNLTALFFFKFQIDSDIVRDNFGQFLAFFLISQWLFIALQEILFENSIGKVFFNLEFKRNHRSLFLRSVVFMGGLLALGVGLYYRPQDRFGEIQLKTKHYA